MTMVRVKHMRSPAPTWGLAALATIVLLVSGCGGVSGVAGPTVNSALRPPVFGERDSVFTDAQLLAAGYTSYAYPPGFPIEPVPALQVYYVNSGSILDSFHRPVLPWTELSTEDVQQARAWAESTEANGNPATAVALAPPIVTPRYFEFHAASGTGVAHGGMRVHRSSYLSGLLTYARGPDDALATFNVRPVAIENVGPLAAYLWWRNTPSYDFGQKVLSSFSTDTPSDVAHTLYTILVSPGAFGVSEQIFLDRVDYRVDKSTGVIRVRTTLVREIDGRPY